VPDLPPLSPDPEDDGVLHRPAPPRSWRERLEGLADATGSTPGRILGGAAAVLLALAGAWWLLRPPPDPPEASLPFASTTLAVGPSPTAASVPATVVVHVAGAVAAPGVYELATGSRVADALDAAGGPTGTADGARLNLAAPVSDGERVYVLAVGEQQVPVARGAEPSTGDPTAASPVDVNTADSAALETLPGIGPATASAILEHRSRVGRFTSVEQLLDVPGIGEAKLAALRDLVTV
jgi:competence protein ComEA